MIVRRARIRLTLLYVAMFAVVLVVFSVVFYVAFALVLQPDIDVDPVLTNAQAAEAAYAAAIERIGLSLLVADAVAVVIVGVVAWILARRTLEPIRDAHLRQQRFVADASHETRNPLAAIKVTTSTALEGDRPPAELRAALVVIDQSVDRLIRLTGDLLVLARSNDPLAPTARDRSDLSVIATEAIEGFTRPYGEPVRANLKPDLPVMVDPADIDRIVHNLLDNAARHGGDVGEIRLATWETDGAAVLEVADDGPGITASDLPRIFDPFYRSGEQPRDKNGTGLGLAIARDLARRNGGELSVSSAPGKGATFRLTLPRLK